jgi:uncharacterized protein YndB with AHSA1/START domain
MSNNSVTLHRVLAAPPEKVFRAFTEASAMVAWLPPYGFTCTVHEFNATPGGKYRMSFRNFGTGHEHAWTGRYTEIKPNESLKYVEQFEDPNLPGEMTTTVQLTKVSAGTDIKIVQEGIPAPIPADMCYLGWQESLEKLKKLVEPVIPDA